MSPRQVPELPEQRERVSLCQTQRSQEVHRAKTSERREVSPSGVRPRSHVYTSLLQNSPAVGTPLPLCSDPSPVENDEGQLPLAELPLPPSPPVPPPAGRREAGTCSEKGSIPGAQILTVNPVSCMTMTSWSFPSSPASGSSWPFCLASFSPLRLSCGALPFMSAVPDGCSAGRGGFRARGGGRFQ